MNTQAFIQAHADDDVRQLALQVSGATDIDVTYALEQIAGRQKARTKLPTWAATEGIVYPPGLALEQCSSEQTARYKAELVSRWVKESHAGSSMPDKEPFRFIDLTGGFGVDFTCMAQAILTAFHPSPLTPDSLHVPDAATALQPAPFTYVEQNPQLFAITVQNLPRFVEGAACVCGDGVEYLCQGTGHYDLIYLDPARRDIHGRRTYGISDCTPDVTAIRDLLLSRADRILIKLSPMLDWRKAVSDIGAEWVHEVHIVSVGNECKELLLVIGNEQCGALREEPGTRVHEPRLTCINLLDDGEQRFSVPISHSLRPSIPPSLHPSISQFLFEPNASVMKAGCFAELSQHYGVQQIEKNSHLFVSAEYVDDFPGRVFQIEAVSSMNKRELKERLSGISQANITVRNFPMDVAALRRRLRLADGGSTYIFATTLADKSHVLLLCRKIS